jgi:hypothetical protein
VVELEGQPPLDQPFPVAVVAVAVPEDLVVTAAMEEMAHLRLAQCNLQALAVEDQVTQLVEAQHLVLRQDLAEQLAVVLVELLEQLLQELVLQEAMALGWVIHQPRVLVVVVAVAQHHPQEQELVVAADCMAAVVAVVAQDPIQVARAVKVSFIFITKREQWQQR